MMNVMTMISAGLLATALAMPAMAEGKKDMPRAKMQQSEVQKSGKVQRTAMISQQRTARFRNANASLPSGKAMSARTANAKASTDDSNVKRIPDTLVTSYAKTNVFSMDPVCKKGEAIMLQDGERHTCQ